MTKLRSASGRFDSGGYSFEYKLEKRTEEASVWIYTTAESLVYSGVVKSNFELTLPHWYGHWWGRDAQWKSDVTATLKIALRSSHRELICT